MNILLIANQTNTEATRSINNAAGWLLERGVTSDQIYSENLILGSLVLDNLAAVVSRYDLVCALGGDGTILRAARVVADTGVPLLGVNSGNLGFLSGATSDSLLAALQAFILDQLVVESRVLLNATITFDDQSQVDYLALNEIVLGRSDMGRAISLNISINNNKLPALRSDGVIVATATGSTAYALSAGGPLLTPDHQGLVVVPISAHTLNSASFVCAGDDAIELRPHAVQSQKSLVCIDGQMLPSGLADKNVESVLITKARQQIDLLRYDAPDFYAKIARLLSGE
jgi:NAD+ kinase